MQEKYMECSPKVHKKVYMADSCYVIGKVSIGKNSSVWHYATIRADLDTIDIGESSCFQERATVHTSRHYPVKIGNNVIVSHAAIVHGCTIEDNVLIGMGSIIMNGAYIGKNSIIGAGSLVTQNTIIESESLYFGQPARFIRKLTKDEIEDLRESSSMYVRLANEYMKK